MLSHFRRIKNWKAAGSTGVVSEMMKASGSFRTWRMTDLINNIVKECCIADDWRKSILLLLFAIRDLWKEWGDSNFQIFSQNCQFHHRRLVSLEHFNVLLYIILSTTVSFLEDTILFLQVSSFFHFVYISIFSQVHFACVLCI